LIKRMASNGGCLLGDTEKSLRRTSAVFW
jgi:hypothetical protein